MNRRRLITTKIHQVTIDATWFRRIFHTFAASFLIYYKLPENAIRIILPVVLFMLVLILEYLRITKKIDNKHFFGLRGYEHTRPASYLYFGIGIFILFLFFPQPIAIPCILCACFADPFIGELRQLTTPTITFTGGFLLCLLFFILAWYTQPLTLALPIAVLGATGAILGEIKKLILIDDDFLIQIIPALLILIVWQLMLQTGIDILPPPLINPY